MSSFLHLLSSNRAPISCCTLNITGLSSQRKGSAVGGIIIPWKHTLLVNIPCYYERHLFFCLLRQRCCFPDRNDDEPPLICQPYLALLFSNYVLFVFPLLRGHIMKVYFVFTCKNPPVSSSGYPSVSLYQVLYRV